MKQPRQAHQAITGLEVPHPLGQMWSKHFKQIALHISYSISSTYDKQTISTRNNLRDTGTLEL